MQKHYVTNVDDYFSKVEREFVLANLEERLREDMNNMRELDCEDLPDYASKFLQTIVTSVFVSNLIGYFFLESILTG